jgi:hypothetical protein
MRQFTGQMASGEMLKVINRVSRDLFDVFKFNYWDNVVISGGYALDLLFDTNTSNDIDLFIYNADKDLIKNIYEQVIKLTKGKVIRENKAVVTLSTSQDKKVQIVNSSDKKTPEEVVAQFDINPCKVWFDGYSLKHNSDAENELKTRTINLTKVSQTFNAQNRIAKYAQYKGWKLKNVSAVTANIDPLYLFKECRSHDKLFQNLFLLNNDTLNKIYEKIFIRKNPNLVAIRNNRSDDYSYQQNNKTVKTHKNTGLSSQIELRPDITETLCNQFGLPDILYRVKTGKYTFEELFESMETDICGFNVSCYMIMYEPSEEKIIEYFNNSEKFTSKNMNKYNLSYVELSALLNRLKLVKFFLKKKNFKNVMAIAVYEDNVELYKMTYKMISSEERYLYKKEDLLKKKAYAICEELYGELKESEKQINSTNYARTHESDKLKEIDTFTTHEEFIKYYYENKKNQTSIMEYVISRSVKTITETDKFKINTGMAVIERLFYQYELEKINKNTNNKFNEFLTTILPEKSYNDHISKTFNNPLNDLSAKYIAIKMHEGTLDPAYMFNNNIVNKVLVFLDNVKLIENNKHKKQLFDNILTAFKSELGPNFKEYMKKNYERVSSIKYYSQILANTEWHDNAYDNCVLDQGYQRCENAIGYTPDDVILFKTLNYYYDMLKDDAWEDAIDCCDEVRSHSVRFIDRSKPIIPFVGTVDKNKVKQAIPEMFNFEHVLDSDNNNNTDTNTNAKEEYELLNSASDIKKEKQIAPSESDGNKKRGKTKTDQ